MDRFFDLIVREGRWEPKECDYKIEGQKEADVSLESYKIRYNTVYSKDNV